MPRVSKAAVRAHLLFQANEYLCQVLGNPMLWPMHYLVARRVMDLWLQDKDPNALKCALIARDSLQTRIKYLRGDLPAFRLVETNL